MKHVVIGSQNPVKVRAVKKAFRTLFPEESFSFASVSVSSGVKEQPMSDDECIRGAINRAKNAMKEQKVDYAVGLEGGICKIQDDYYAKAWMAVVNKKGTLGLGSSLAAPVTKKIMKLVLEGKELGLAVDIVTGKHNTKHQGGYFGLITSDIVPREKAYIHGVMMALAKFRQPHLFR